MFKPLLKPDLYLESIFQIPYEQLYEQGIRGLIYDVDNTLVNHGEKQTPSKIVSLVERLRQMGFQVGLLSNNNAQRINAFNEPIQLPGASNAAKPFTASLRRLMREMCVSPHETAIIGDQLFTDIWCGKRAGLLTILVKPISVDEIILVRLKRGLERRMLKRYLRQTH